MKRPFVTRSQLDEIVQEYPTPFHLYDEKGLRENARRVNAAFAWNPGFKEYFAVKATPNPAILKLLREEGCGADCSSLVELLLAEKCGFRGHEIMFSSNNTLAEEYRLADKLGAVINLDDLTHVAFLEQSIGHIPETVFCRYNPGGVFTLGEGKDGLQVMDTPGDAKYGMTRPQIAQAFRALRAKGARTFGIHAFLASNTISNQYYPELAGILFRLAAELKEETGCHIGYINLSGGIGIPYRPEEEANDIALIGRGVQQKFEEILIPAGMGDVRLCGELGRFMTGPYGCLVTRVLHFKHIYKEYVGVDACAADLMRPAVYGAYHHITAAGKEDVPCTQTVDVTGSLCENCDKFAVDRPLPPLEAGDLLVIHDTGAHGHSMGYNYNGKLRSAELLLQEDGGVRLIRRAETPEDYFATAVW
ncbi:MAG: diaminopimelate decarboxylase [Oscillospiraceae bacterium]|jgi:diaminopimelate decarboxylase|nr:diaminopimelate decarboxylase [Oscillospiraceae bacterium]